MKTRTAFKLIGSEGVVHCWCGCLRDFILDIENYVIPILEDKIIARFNDREILVYPSDTAEIIYENFKKVLY